VRGRDEEVVVCKEQRGRSDDGGGRGRGYGDIGREVVEEEVGCRCRRKRNRR
jgi:hypothetical protein